MEVAEMAEMSDKKFIGNTVSFYLRRQTYTLEKKKHEFSTKFITIQYSVTQSHIWKFPFAILPTFYSLLILPTFYPRCVHALTSTVIRKLEYEKVTVYNC